MNVFQVFFRLVLAVIFGGIVGWERERYRKPAGFRTHILVCIGSALFMMTSIYIYNEFGKGVDVSRMAAQVITGIGFIGAGTIWLSRGSVRGLTTAASLWTVAGVGLAIGCGFYTGAFLATITIITVLIALSHFDEKEKSKNG